LTWLVVPGYPCPIILREATALLLGALDDAYPKIAFRHNRSSRERRGSIGAGATACTAAVLEPHVAQRGTDEHQWPSQRHRGRAREWQAGRDLCRVRRRSVEEHKRRYVVDARVRQRGCADLGGRPRRPAVEPEHCL